MKAAIIIGGGPAGCQCALWLHMLGYETVIIEKSDRLGGLQTKSPYINDWLVGTLDLQGQQIAKNIQTQIEKINIPVRYNSTINSLNQLADGFQVAVGDENFRAHNLVISTGVRPRSDGFKKTANVIVGPGKEVYDESFVGKRIAIIGGGDNAAENYSFIQEKKPLYCHVYARTVRARKNLWEKVNLKDTFLGGYQADQASMTVTYNNKKLSYDYFIVLYGWEANIPEAMSNFRENLVNERGFIGIDKFRRTKIPNIFAAGEVTHFLHPCVSTSMADGVIVAKSIQFQLENKN